MWMGNRSVTCLLAFICLVLMVHSYVVNDSLSETSGEFDPTLHFEIKHNECGMGGLLWRNQLDSQMLIVSCENNELKGAYNSKVGQAKNWYRLFGGYTVTKVHDKVMAVEVGWAVAWNNSVLGNSNSVTTWSGIYYPDNGTIYTQWLLTRYRTQDQLWESTMINHDEFKPYKP